MKITSSLILAFLGLLLISSSGNGQTVTAEKLWATPDILTTSESVCYHPELKLFYVSCINGNPLEKDGNGFIATVSLTGDVVTQKWATGLNAPKGMGIYKDKLFVTDIDRIVVIAIETGDIETTYPVEGAVFLNDIAVSPQGWIFVSDMSTNKIHRVEKGIISTWLEDESLQGTNGLYCEPKELLIGTKNGIFSVRYEDKRIWHLIMDTGSIDGLEADGKGNYIISDWMGKVQLVNENNEPFELFNTTEKGINAADIEYVIDRQLLLVPTFGDNRVTAWEITYQ
jgi:sugar lactone lactonase YvrE